MADFVQLPKEIQERIITYLTRFETAQTSVEAINSVSNIFYLVENLPNLNTRKIFDDIPFCYNLIKNISRSFSSNDMGVSFKLKDLNLVFKKIYENQKQLSKICDKPSATSTTEFLTLIRHHPNVDLNFTYHNHTPLDMCVSNLNLSIASEIIKHAIQTNQIKDIDIFTPLSRLSYDDKKQQTKDMADLLLKSLIEFTNPKKIPGLLSSLLAVATEHFNMSMIDSLLKAGADPRIPASQNLGSPSATPKIALTIAQYRPKILELFNEQIKKLDQDKK